MQNAWDSNIGQAIDVVKKLRAVNAACLEVLKKARASRDDATLLRAVDRLHRQIELQARLLGELPVCARYSGATRWSSR